jgi:hypothetical protein
VDQVALDLKITAHNGTTLSVVTLIIDRSTKLILGSGLTAGDGIGMGVSFALRDAQSRLVGFQDYAVPVASHISELTWVVPPALEYTASAMQNDEPEDHGVKLAVIATGPRRHGDNIMRLLGDRLGPHSFRPLAALGEDPPSAEGAGLHPTDAPVVWARAVDQWNNKILARAERAEPDGVRLDRLKRIYNELTRLFRPVFDRVEARQAEARSTERGRSEGWW